MEERKMLTQSKRDLLANNLRVAARLLAQNDDMVAVTSILALVDSELWHGVANKRAAERQEANSPWDI
jgi:hypothetical protein